MPIDTTTKIPAYNDSFNENGSEGILESPEGYRYRVINELMMPPYVTPRLYDETRSMETRVGDISFGSFPKSGSTWLSQIILLLLNGGQNPNHGYLRQHMIWAESSWPYPRPIQEVKELESPRIFKSHMPHSMSLGGGPSQQPAKYIYVMRNPKDVCVSYYHFETGKAWAGNFDCSWDRWFDLFLEGSIQRGNWFDHVLGWWQERSRDNLKILTYEGLLLDFDNQVRSLAEYLNVDLSEEMLRDVERHSSFDTMKDSEFSNMHQVEQLETFYRRGKIGSWKQHFSESQNQRFDEMIEQRLGGTGLEFVFEPPAN